MTYISINLGLQFKVYNSTMNYKLTHKLMGIKSCSYFSFASTLQLGYIIYYDKEYILHIVDSISYLELASMKFERDFSHVLYDKKVYFGLLNKIIVLNLENLEFSELISVQEENSNLWMLSHSIVHNRTVKFQNWEILEESNKIFKIYDATILYKWEDSRNLLLFSEKDCLFETTLKGDLMNINVETGEWLWKIEMDEGIGGRRYISEYDDKLIVWSKPHYLNKIDKQTGQIDWRIENMSPYIISSHTKYYYILNRFNFHEIDVERHHVETYDIEDEMKRFEAYPSWKNTYYKHIIHFSNASGGILGAFSIIKKKILWTYDLSEAMLELGYQANLDSPIIVDEKLYIRDHQGTLWIFEKT